MCARRTSFCLLVAAAIVGSLALSPADARASCREVTVPTPAGYDPAVRGCYYPLKSPRSDRGVFDLYWKNLCVGYSVAQGASSQVTLDQANRLAAEAFAAWTGSTCAGGGPPSIFAINEGPVQCSSVRYNAPGGNQHVIAFRDTGWPYDDSSNTLGLTTLTVDLGTGQIYDADIEINSHDFTLTVDGVAADSRADAGGDSYDLLGILTHEAGHFLGLAHSDDPSATMYARYTPRPGPVGPDDVAGICAMVPPGGTRSTSTGTLRAEACDPAPMNGFSLDCQGTLSDAGQTASALMCPTSTGCSAAGPPRAAGGLWLCGLAGCAAVVRGRWRRSRPAIRALGFALVGLLGAGAVGTGDARASVSVAVLFEDLVRSATAAAVVEAKEQHSAWEQGRIFTYTRVRVESVVAGSLAAEVVVRTMGGEVDNVGQIVDGEAVFALGQRSLVFLHPRIDPFTGLTAANFVVVARGQGQFSIVVDQAKSARLEGTGRGALVPPSAARLAHSAPSFSDGPPRLARDVLNQRSLDEAARDITAAWAIQHR